MLIMTSLWHHHYRSWRDGVWPTLHTGSCSRRGSPRFNWLSRRRVCSRGTVRTLTMRVAPPSSPLPPPLSLYPSPHHNPHPSSPHNCHKAHISHSSRAPPHNRSAKRLKWYTFRWERISALNSNTFDTTVFNTDAFDTAALNSDALDAVNLITFCHFCVFNVLNLLFCCLQVSTFSPLIILQAFSPLNPMSTLFYYSCARHTARLRWSCFCYTSYQFSEIPFMWPHACSERLAWLQFIVPKLHSPGQH